MVRVGWDFLTGANSAEEALARIEADERPLGAWLLDVTAARGLNRSSVIRRSRLNQTFAYQIFAGLRQPSRDKLIQLAFGLGLGIEEACELLERGGTSALRSTCPRDVVVAFCLDRHLDISACDDVLWSLGQRTLVQPDA